MSYILQQQPTPASSSVVSFFLHKVASSSFEGEKENFFLQDKSPGSLEAARGHVMYWKNKLTFER